MTDHPLIPAKPGLHKEIVLLRAVSVNTAITDAKTGNANASGFHQCELQIALTKCEAAKPRKVGLLTTKPGILLGQCHIRGACNGMAPAGTVQVPEKPFGNRREVLLVLTICSTIFNA